MAGSRAQRALEREVFWMTAALINARDNAEQFRKLVAVVRQWPDAKILAVADRIAPAPGILRDRAAALAAIAGFAPDREVQAEIKRTAGALLRQLP